MARSICGNERRWRPIKVDKWIRALDTMTVKDVQLLSNQDVQRNLAYNFQYLEYLQQTLKEFPLHPVLERQTYKSYIIVATGIMESVLFFLNRATGGDDERLFEVLVRLKKDEVLGHDKKMYANLDWARKLRNKVHLHKFKDNLGTDYATFEEGEFNKIKDTLMRLMTSKHVGLAEEYEILLAFLRRDDVPE